MERLHKGLAELVGTVLIIAFVIAVAVIVTTFSSTFVREQVGKTTETGGAVVDCTKAAVEIVPDSIVIRDSRLRVTVKNVGLIDLNDVDVVYRNTSVDPFQTAELNASLKSGDIRTLDIAGFNNGVDRIIAKSGCPGRTDEVENVSGVFKRVNR